MGTLAGVTREEEDTIPDAQVTCQQQQMGAEETSATALVVDLRVHDREVAENRPPRVSVTVPEQPDLRVPTRSRLVQEKTRECRRCPSSSKVSLLNKTAQWHASATWNLFSALE